MASRNFPRLVEQYDADAAALRAVGHQTGALKSGGGDGTSGGMEARVARLEADVDYIKRDVGELKADVRSVKGDVTAIRIDLARLDERVTHLPTKWFVVTSLTGIVGMFTVLSIFGDKVRALFGL
jgi:outer membrane murein-binding lipoprotein Lpp